MALNATPGAADADSYLTVAEADAYIATRLHTTGWPTDTDTKERALKMATRTIDGNVCFTGASATTTQALAWPRSGMVSRQGGTIASDVIPQELKNATAELALLLVRGDRTLENEAAAAGLSELKAGPVTLKFLDEIAVNTVPPGVTNLLVPSWLCENSDDLDAFEFTAL